MWSKIEPNKKFILQIVTRTPLFETAVDNFDFKFRGEIIYLKNPNHEYGQKNQSQLWNHVHNSFYRLYSSLKETALSR